MSGNRRGKKKGTIKAHAGRRERDFAMRRPPWSLNDNLVISYYYVIVADIRVRVCMYSLGQKDKAYFFYLSKSEKVDLCHVL